MRLGRRAHPLVVAQTVTRVTSLRQRPPDNLIMDTDTKTEFLVVRVALSLLAFVVAMVVTVVILLELTT